MIGWGNSYDIKPGHKTAPLEGLDPDTKYAMRCEYPNHVAVQCLCPEKKRQKEVHKCVAKKCPYIKISRKNGGSTTILALNIVGIRIFIDRLGLYAVNMLIVLWGYNALMEPVQHVPTLNVQIDLQVMGCWPGEILANTVNMNVPMSAVGRVSSLVQVI